MKTVTIYTDGSSKGNPGPGGWAAVLDFNGIKKEIYGSEEETTNNRMELTAVIKALEILKEPCNAIIYSDSKYFCDSLGKGWVQKWKDNGWKKSDGKPTLNTKLWARIIFLAKIHKIRVVWVKGHAGNENNERCDFLATSAAESVIKKSNKKFSQ